MSQMMAIQARKPAQSTPVSVGPVLQRKCDKCRKKKPLQRAAAGPGPESVPPIVHEVLRSPGQPLDRETRAFMEPRLGHDFSQVRVHADSKAVESARAVNALAYAVGKDIVFAERQHVPTSIDGRKLLAHELTHVVQQGSAENRLSKLTVGSAKDQYEQEADRIASSVTEGKPQSPSLRSESTLRRRIGDGHDLSARRFSGNITLEAVFDGDRLLQRGDSGTAVRLIQESLVAQGYTLPKFGVDGKFGTETEAVVRQFQIDTGAVKLDGIIGPETMQLLDMHDTGTTKATGPRATAPPAGAPAAPPSTGVAFSEEAGEQFAGYDASVAPNFLVVPTNGRRRARTVINPAGARPAFSSLDPAIATVDVTANGIAVTGGAGGTTEIQAQEGGAILDRLRVSVKDRLDRSVAFHFVSDSAVGPGLPHHSNGAPSANEMRSLLNRVWERQANVRFTGGAAHNVVAPGDLGPTVDSDGSGGGEMGIVTALGTGADYNVFRVWDFTSPACGHCNGGLTNGNNTLIADAACADGLGLAHEAGHFLGVGHANGFIMATCGGRVDRRVSKAMADVVNP
jgi:peptidoglycan hydrolase-like protein with peptidoglycan-binding domain